MNTTTTTPNDNPKRNISIHDDEIIPIVDSLQNRNTFQEPQPKDLYHVEPLPESTRPRKDGPGGEEGQ